MAEPLFWETIKAKLETLTDLQAVYYGGIPAKHTLTRYNYAVISKARHSLGSGSKVTRYNIYIVMENQIPEEYIPGVVIPKLKEVQGLKIDDEVQYSCERIQNTANLLEAGAFVVFKKEKWC